MSYHTLPHKAPLQARKVCALLREGPPTGRCPYPTSPLPRPVSIHRQYPCWPQLDLPRRDYHA
jgi:hypothetical protein